MSKLLNHSTWSDYSPNEWVCAKISVAYFWFVVVISVSINHQSIPYPTGIYSFIDGSLLASKYTVRIFSFFAFVLAVLYVREKWMTATIFLMFLLSLVLFTLEESGGILNRNYLYTAVFFAQFIAYYRNTERLNEERIQFAVQIIAGGYVLAGISKLQQSGIGWITSAPLVSIQIIKGYCFTYFNTGNIKDFEPGLRHANFILSHRYLAEGLFAGSLTLELFAWIAVINKRSAFIYGLLLLAMHIGISYFMNILIISIVYPMLIFMINPLYLIYGFVRRHIEIKKPQMSVEQ